MFNTKTSSEFAVHLVLGAEHRNGSVFDVASCTLALLLNVPEKTRRSAGKVHASIVTSHVSRLRF